MKVEFDGLGFFKINTTMLCGVCCLQMYHRTSCVVCIITDCCFFVDVGIYCYIHHNIQTTKRMIKLNYTFVLTESCSYLFKIYQSLQFRHSLCLSYSLYNYWYTPCTLWILLSGTVLWWYRTRQQQRSSVNQSGGNNHSLLGCRLFCDYFDYSTIYESLLKISCIAGCIPEPQKCFKHKM
jgi:hypothetical protein